MSRSEFDPAREAVAGADGATVQFSSPAWSDLDSDEPRAGDEVGPYTLERELGRGGMGVVWLASRSDGAYRRQVALKLSHGHRLAGSAAVRFRRERDILAALTHPNIAQFLDAGVTPRARPYLVLEYVSGCPITESCDAGRRSIAQRLALVRQITAALHHAHGHLIVHRDIKPSNVLVAVDEAGDERVKLLDFGIAKLLGAGTDAPEEAQLTAEHGRIATPDYAAPEQLLGGEVTVATDVYSLGVLLFELLTGRLPFDSARGASRLLQFTEPRGEAPLASTRVDPDHANSVAEMAPAVLERALRGDLDAILAKALAIDPVERYDAVASFAADLDRFARFEPIQARRIGRLARVRKLVRRQPLAVGLGSALALAIVVGVAGVLWQSARTASQARRAEATKEFLVSVFQGSDPRVLRDRPRGEITARELVDLAAGRIERELRDAPETRLELLELTATIYSYLDEVDSARRLARLYREEVAAHLPGDDPKVVDALHFEVWLALQAGDVPLADSLLLDLDQRLRRHQLDHSRHRAEWYLAAADVAGEQGDLARRERALERSMELYRQFAPLDSGHEAALSNLGNLVFSRDEFLRALSYLDAALAVALEAGGNTDTDRARIQARRGRVLTELGRLEPARAAFADSRRHFAGTVGADHVGAWQAIAGLARALHLGGDRAGAELLFAELEAQPAYAEPSHRSRRAEVDALHGICLAEAGRAQEAIGLLTSAIATLRTNPEAAGDRRRAERALQKALAAAGRGVPPP